MASIPTGTIDRATKLLIDSVARDPKLSPYLYNAFSDAVEYAAKKNAGHMLRDAWSLRPTEKEAQRLGQLMADTIYKHDADMLSSVAYEMVCDYIPTRHRDTE